VKKRIFVFLGSFLTMYLFNFFIPRLMPGDPFTYTSSVSGEDSAIEFSEEQREMMRAYYGLDKPLPAQLADTVKGNLRGDFGKSIHYKRPVADVILERLPWSLLIMGVSLTLSLLIGCAQALASIRSGQADRYIYAAHSVISEIPPFLIGVTLLFFVAARIQWIPLSGSVTPFAGYASPLDRIWDIAVHAMLPVTAMTAALTPQFYFTARASFLHISSMPYVLYAKAKGLPEMRVRWLYILRNGAAPIVARFFLSVGTAVGGTLLIENVFAYAGLGTVMREAVRFRDYLMIQGIFLLSSVIVLSSLFLADLFNAMADHHGEPS
jgi:peptide/nickel transport system permease protein